MENSESVPVSVFAVTKQLRCQLPGGRCGNKRNMLVPECCCVVSKWEVFSDPIYIECSRRNVSEVSQAGVSNEFVSFGSINAVSTHGAALISFRQETHFER